MNNQPKAQVNINLDAMPDEICGADRKNEPFPQDSKCECNEFVKVFRYKRISALVSPTGRDQVIELQFIKCMECGAQKVIK